MHHFARRCLSHFRSICTICSIQANEVQWMPLPNATAECAVDDGFLEWMHTAQCANASAVCMNFGAPFFLYKNWKKDEHWRRISFSVTMKMAQFQCLALRVWASLSTAPVAVQIETTDSFGGFNLQSVSVCVWLCMCILSTIDSLSLTDFPLKMLAQQRH